MQSAPLNKEAVTVYISLSEMKNLVAAIKDSITMPLQTGNAEVLGSFEFLPEGGGSRTNQSAENM
jgi:hypothetical protein